MKIYKMYLPLLLLMLFACKEVKKSHTENKNNTTHDYLAQGKDFVLQGDCESAISSFTKAIREDPKNADIYFNRAYCKDYLGNKKEAFQDYSKAIDINPKFVDALNNRGELFRKFKKDYEAAINDYSAAIQLNGKLSGLFFNKALAYVAIKKNGKALEDFTKVIEMSPKVKEAYFNRAALYLELGYKDNACKDWARAYELGKEESADFVKKYCL